jgi:hypothetical protein
VGRIQTRIFVFIALAVAIQSLCFAQGEERMPQTIMNAMPDKSEIDRIRTNNIESLLRIVRQNIDEDLPHGIYFEGCFIRYLRVVSRNSNERLGNIISVRIDARYVIEGDFEILDGLMYHPGVDGNRIFSEHGWLRNGRFVPRNGDWTDVAVFGIVEDSPRRGWWLKIAFEEAARKIADRCEQAR